MGTISSELEKLRVGRQKIFNQLQYVMLRNFSDRTTALMKGLAHIKSRELYYEKLFESREIRKESLGRVRKFRELVRLGHSSEIARVLALPQITSLKKFHGFDECQKLKRAVSRLEYLLHTLNFQTVQYFQDETVSRIPLFEYESRKFFLTREGIRMQEGKKMPCAIEGREVVFWLGQSAPFKSVKEIEGVILSWKERFVPAESANSVFV